MSKLKIFFHIFLHLIFVWCTIETKNTKQSLSSDLLSTTLSNMPFANEDTNPDIVDQRTPSHEHEEMYSDINNSNKKETEKEDQNKENYTRTVKNQIQLRNFNSKQTKESPRLVIGIISSHYSKKSIKICTIIIYTLTNSIQNFLC